MLFYATDGTEEETEGFDSGLWRLHLARKRCLHFYYFRWCIKKIRTLDGVGAGL